MQKWWTGFSPVLLTLLVVVLIKLSAFFNYWAKWLRNNKSIFEHARAHTHIVCRFNCWFTLIWSLYCIFFYRRAKSMWKLLSVTYPWMIVQKQLCSSTKVTSSHKKYRFYFCWNCISPYVFYLTPFSFFSPKRAFCGWYSFVVSVCCFSCASTRTFRVELGYVNWLCELIHDDLNPCFKTPTWFLLLCYFVYLVFICVQGEEFFLSSHPVSKFSVNYKSTM